ncbi:hypothetical protein LCGC14_2064060 [marine sediment metagenome]|uniref:Uncharacterized protein n=1 Tax=marine sediment metagenome TaxID=412755 RepID=A0A0F9HHB9_9ZZZZ
MLKTEFGFAPGTSDDCQKVVARFPPDRLLNAYKTAQAECLNNDIVLWMTDQSPDIYGGTRAEYKQHLRRLYGVRALEFRMWDESAQKVMSMPAESEAMWFVMHVSGADIPIMCVLYAMLYEVEAAAS